MFLNCMNYPMMTSFSLFSRIYFDRYLRTSSGLSFLFETYYNVRKYVIYDAAVLEEPQVPVVVDDVDWGDEMGGVFLAYFYVFVLADVVSVIVHSRAFHEQVFVTSESFVVSVLYF